MTNAIKLNEGTAKVFTESGGDYVWTPKNVANGAGRLSAQGDLGAAPRAKWYRWVLVSKFQTATAGAAIRLYIIPASTAATTYQDGLIGTGDAALAGEALAQYGNGKVFTLLVQHTTNSNVWSGLVHLPARYVSAAIWNASGVALTNTAGDHIFRLEPVYDEIQ